MRQVRQSLAMIALIAVCACTPRGEFAPVAAPAGIGTDVEVYVASTRAQGTSGLHDRAARADLSYSNVTVSIPPEHETGGLSLGGSNPDPHKHFITREIAPLPTRPAFRAEVARALRERPNAQNEAFVFVHGFNTTMAEGIFRTAQLAHDLDLPALPVHYAWPSSGNPLGYAHDRDSALFARRGLQLLIEDLAAARTGDIILVAHSMGTHLLMETLRQMALSGGGPGWERIAGVVLIAPDIDVDVFHAQVADIGTLPQPFFLLTSDRDPALRLSARLTGERNRLGNLADPAQVAALEVTVIDVSKFRDGSNGHVTAISSPSFLAMSRDLNAVETTFREGASGRTGLLPGTVLTLQNATAVVLEPAETLSDLSGG